MLVLFYLCILGYLLWTFGDIGWVIVWISLCFQDYILLVPTRSFFPTLLDTDPVDIFPEFQHKCARNNFLIKPSASRFCLSSVFTLTSRFNRGTVPCRCDKQGSLSDRCQSYGGQCRCRNNVIGRTCNSCKTGYTGFPNCRRRWQYPILTWWPNMVLANQEPLYHLSAYTYIYICSQEQVFFLALMLCLFSAYTSPIFTISISHTKSQRSSWSCFYHEEAASWDEISEWVSNDVYCCKEKIVIGCLAWEVDLLALCT